MLVKCNWCERTMDENKVAYCEIEGCEYCPECGRSGYLMSLEEDINNERN